MLVHKNSTILARDITLIFFRIPKQVNQVIESKKFQLTKFEAVALIIYVIGLLVGQA